MGLWLLAIGALVVPLGLSFVGHKSKWSTRIAMIAVGLAGINEMAASRGYLPTEVEEVLFWIMLGIAVVALAYSVRSDSHSEAKD